MHHQFRNNRMNRAKKSNCITISLPVPEFHVAGSIDCHQRNHNQTPGFNCQRLQCFILLDMSNCPVLPNALWIQNCSCATSLFHHLQKEDFFFFPQKMPTLSVFFMPMSTMFNSQHRTLQPPLIHAEEASWIIENTLQVILFQSLGRYLACILCL